MQTKSQVEIGFKPKLEQDWMNLNQIKQTSFGFLDISKLEIWSSLERGPNQTGITPTYFQLKKVFQSRIFYH